VDQKVTKAECGILSPEFEYPNGFGRCAGAASNLNSERAFIHFFQHFCFLKGYKLLCEQVIQFLRGKPKKFNLFLSLGFYKPS